MRHFSGELNLMMTDVLEVRSDVMINKFGVLNKLWGLDPLIIKIIAWDVLDTINMINVHE